MSDYITKRLKRAVEDRQRGGMQTGLPKITLHECDVIHAYTKLGYYIDLADKQAQRLRDLETDINLLKGMLIEDGYSSRYLDEITTVKETKDHDQPEASTDQDATRS